MLVASIAYLFANVPATSKYEVNTHFSLLQIVSLDKAPIREIRSFGKLRSPERPKKCHMYNCFDIYRCGKSGDGILSIYIYPFENYYLNGKPVQNSISKEFYEIVDTIRKSSFYNPNPNKACVFVPTIDLLQSFSSIQTMRTVLHNLEQ